MMKSKIELLKSLGFDNDFLQLLEQEDGKNKYRKRSVGPRRQNDFTFEHDQMVYPVIELTEKPVSYIINSSY